VSWKKLLNNKNVVREAASKAELDNLRTIVSRSLTDVAAPGLSADARFIMAVTVHGPGTGSFFPRFFGWRPMRPNNLGGQLPGKLCLSPFLGRERSSWPTMRRALFP
jgi:hypothetical protein